MEPYFECVCNKCVDLSQWGTATTVLLSNVGKQSIVAAVCASHLAFIRADIRGRDCVCKHLVMLTQAS